MQDEMRNIRVLRFDVRFTRGFTVVVSIADTGALSQYKIVFPGIGIHIIKTGWL